MDGWFIYSNSHYVSLKKYVQIFLLPLAIFLYFLSLYIIISIFIAIHFHLLQLFIFYNCMEFHILQGYVVTWNVIIVGHATHGYGLDAVMLVKIHEIVCCFLLLVHILFCAILGQENTDQSTSMERKITHTWSGKYRSALLRIQSNEFNQSTSMERKITHTWSGKYISFVPVMENMLSEVEETEGHWKNIWSKFSFDKIQKKTLCFG
ncbi:hypothetical protein ACJX0J_035679 [Zea mays]